VQLPKSDNQKLKILYILDYLQKNSHQDHPVRASELAKMLEGHGILCDRKTIYSDIAALQDFGIDILIYRGKNGGYYIGQRQFQLPELKLLIGAVQSSRFLTEEKSLELIDKLCRLCSQEEAEQVRRNVVVAGRIKNMNQSIYYDVDTIQEAIFQNRQISFRYFDWGLDGKPKYRDRDYTASPYGLYQDNENCYLLALSPRHGVTAYRVDRMNSIALLPRERTPLPGAHRPGPERLRPEAFPYVRGGDRLRENAIPQEPGQCGHGPVRQRHHAVPRRGGPLRLHRGCGGIPPVLQLDHRLRQQGPDPTPGPHPEGLPGAVPGGSGTI